MSTVWCLFMLVDNYNFRRYNYSVFNFSLNNKFILYLNFFFLKKTNILLFNFFINIFNFLNKKLRNVVNTNYKFFKFLPFKFFSCNLNSNNVNLFCGISTFLLFKNYVIYSFFFLKKRNVFFYFIFFKKNINSYFFSYKKNFLINSNMSVLSNFNFFLPKKEVNFDFSNSVVFSKNRLNLYKLLINNSLSNVFLNINKFSFFTSFNSVYLLWNFIFFFPSLNFLILNSFIKNSFFLNFNKKVNTFLKKNDYFFKFFNISSHNFVRMSQNYIIEHLRLKTKLLYLIEDSIYQDILVRTVENIVKHRVQILINRDITEQLSSKEWLYIELFRKRIISLSFNIHPLLNTRILQNKTLLYRNIQNNFWNEVIVMCFLFYKSRDTMILLSFLYYRMQNINMFSHKNFLKKIFLVLRLIFPSAEKLFGVKGLKLRISGKISVTGNSRTRTMLFKQGLTSYSNMNIKSDYSFNIIRTDTGCLGLSIWIFF